MKIQIFILALLALTVFTQTDPVVEADPTGTDTTTDTTTTDNTATDAAATDDTTTPDTNPGSPVTTDINAPPVPVETTVPAGDAADNLSDSADALDDVSDDNVIITNPDGTTSIVDASDEASDLHDAASDVSDLDSDTPVTVPDGGNVPFVPLDEDATGQTLDANGKPIAALVARTCVVSAGAVLAGCVYLLV